MTRAAAVNVKELMLTVQQQKVRQKLILPVLLFWTPEVDDSERRWQGTCRFQEEITNALPVCAPYTAVARPTEYPQRPSGRTQRDLVPNILR